MKKQSIKIQKQGDLGGISQPGFTARRTLALHMANPGLIPIIIPYSLPNSPKVITEIRFRSNPWDRCGPKQTNTQKRFWCSLTVAIIFALIVGIIIWSLGERVKQKNRDYTGAKGVRGLFP